MVIFYLKLWNVDTRVKKGTLFQKYLLCGFFKSVFEEIDTSVLKTPYIYVTLLTSFG